MVPPAYGWKDDHGSFALVTKTEDLNSYKEAIEADDGTWIIPMEQKMSLWIEIKHKN